MADIDVLRVLAAIVLLFFIPGFFLWKALVPRPKDVAEEFAAVYTLAFSMALSIAVDILVGIVLGALPPDPVTGKGHLLDYNLPALLLVTLVSAGVAWYRGAFPKLSALSPALKRQPKPPPDGSGVGDEPKRYWREQDLLARRLEVRAQLKRKERTGSVAGRDRGHYQRQRAELTEELVKLDEELKALRAERERAIEQAEEEAVRVEKRRRERRDTVLRFLRLKRGRGDKAAGGKPE
jgi:hypothetical protein